MPLQLDQGIAISRPEDKVTLHLVPASVKRGYPPSLTFVQEVKPWQQNWTKWVPQSHDSKSRGHSSRSVSRPGLLVLKRILTERQLPCRVQCQPPGPTRSLTLSRRLINMHVTRSGQFASGLQGCTKPSQSSPTRR